jgi:nitroreductase
MRGVGQLSLRSGDASGGTSRARLGYMDPDRSDQLMWLLACRRSARVPFDPARAVSEAELADLVTAARWAPTVHVTPTFQLVVIDAADELAALGAICAPLGAPLAIVVLYDAEDGDVLGKIGLGCVLENMWLVAHAHHLAVQVVSVHAGVEREVLAQLGVPAPWRIAYALRVGHTVRPDTGSRVRRDTATFVHRNRF